MSEMSIPQMPATAAEEIAWTAAQGFARQGSVFGYRDLADAVMIPHDRASQIIRAWLARGLVAEVAERPNGRRMFRLVSMAGGDLPRGRTAEQNLWTALRSQGAVSPVDLASLADTDTVRVTIEQARAYCQLLTRTGYLRVIRKAVPGRVEAVYKLVVNTGPSAPRLRRVPAIHDPNKGTITPIGGAA